MTTATQQIEDARDITEKCGYAAAALTLLPIPGSEVIAVMPLHVGMVVKIGQIYGVDLDRDSATHLIMRIGATVGLSLVGSRLATTAAKIILPGLGGLISAPFMYASTLAIGRVAEAYFQHGELSDRRMKSIYRSTVKTARRGFDPVRARSRDARRQAQDAAEDADAGTHSKSEDPADRLTRLKKLLDQGLIDAEEYAETKKRVLAEI